MILVPFKILPHLLIFFFKEFEGVHRRYAGRECKAVRLLPSSTIGKYIINNLVKIAYPVKNINSFNIFIEIENVKDRTVIVSHNVYKKECLTNSFLELPEDNIKDVNEMLDNIFRTAFYYYVSGSSRNGQKITEAINQFISEYELYQFDFLNFEQLRQLYYRMKSEGGISRFQDQTMSWVKYR